MPQKNKENKPDTKEQEPVSVGRYAVLDDRFQIDTKAALPQLNVALNKAYKVESIGRVSEKMFALVCEKNFIPRRAAADLYLKVVDDNAVKLLSHGVVYWPPAKQERYVFIYRREAEKPLIKDDQKQALAMNQDVVMSDIIIPFVHVLQEFYKRDFVHGSIRADNIYVMERGAQKRFVLGDALSTQVSYAQPALYETIPRGQADPLARGKGILSDDLYSFGVLLAVLMRSHDTTEGMDDDAIIHDKIIKGSFAVVAGKERFRGGVSDLLRGLLNDNASERWTLDEVSAWLDGKRLPPKQVMKRKKAVRPFAYAGKKYALAETLSMSLYDAPQETMKVVEDGSLEQWLKRSLENDDLVVKIEEAYESSIKYGRSAGYEDRLVANTISALDCYGPIRFRGQRMSGNGVGLALYEACALRLDLGVFKDMFAQDIVMNWLKLTQDSSIDVAGLLNRYDDCKRYLLQKSQGGYGIERCLYHLVPEAPCLSPALDDYYVTSPLDVLRAYEGLCEKGDMMSSFFDPHVIAFLSVYENKVVEPYINDLSNGNGYNRAYATLRCFATMQKYYDAPPLPNLAHALNNQLASVYMRFHDRETREKMKENAAQFVAAGDLVKLAEMFMNKSIFAKDFKDFKMKYHEYHELKEEHLLLTKGLEDKTTFGRDAGHYVGAIVSSAISAFAIFWIAFQYF